jgi:hypothetical protein
MALRRLPCAPTRVTLSVVEPSRESVTKEVKSLLFEAA